MPGQPRKRRQSAQFAHPQGEQPRGKGAAHGRAVAVPQPVVARPKLSPERAKLGAPKASTGTERIKCRKEKKKKKKKKTVTYCLPCNQCKLYTGSYSYIGRRPLADEKSHAVVRGNAYLPNIRARHRWHRHCARPSSCCNTCLPLWSSPTRTMCCAAQREAYARKLLRSRVHVRYLGTHHDFMSAVIHCRSRASAAPSRKQPIICIPPCIHKKKA